MGKHVKITLLKDGKIETETSGFNGVGCMETTNALLDQIIKSTVNSRTKNEYYVNENEACIGA
jgi:hypothetical protein